MEEIGQRALVSMNQEHIIIINFHTHDIDQLVLLPLGS